MLLKGLATYEEENNLGLKQQAPDLSKSIEDYLVEKQKNFKAELQARLEQHMLHILRTIEIYSMSSFRSLMALFPDILKPKICRKNMHRTIFSQLEGSSYELISPALHRSQDFQHLCDYTTDEGGWIIVQRRQSGRVNFSRTWQEYKDGFGDFHDDFWLGNDKIHALTMSWTYELRVEVTFRGRKSYALYDSFYLGSDFHSYRLKIGRYSGTAGDSLRYHNGGTFSTIDRDNDERIGGSCARKNGGGWWFVNCDTANLNGRWGVGQDRGMEWSGVGGYQSVASSEMKIRRV